MFNEGGFTKVGICRFIVLRTNAAESRDVERGYSMQIIGTDSFSYGFCCPKDQNYVSRGSLSEDLFLFEHDLYSALKDKPNGFYEILCDTYMRGWTSYEGEYDCEGELRDVKMQSISYDQALYFDDHEILAECSKNLLDGDLRRQAISPYMERIQILRHYAHALADLLRTYNSPWLYTKDMTDKQLQDYIFMATLEIDSEELAQPERAKRAKEMHPLVDSILAEREELMANG